HLFSLYLILFACAALLFYHYTATTEFYTLSLHDALPICLRDRLARQVRSFDAHRRLVCRRVVDSSSASLRVHSVVEDLSGSVAGMLVWPRNGHTERKRRERRPI